MKTNRIYRSYSGTSGGFSDSARMAAAKARSEKKTRELQALYLSFVGTGAEEFRVVGLLDANGNRCEGLRWAITSVDTVNQTVAVETTDRTAPFRAFAALPYRGIVHSPLCWLSEEEAAQAGTRPANSTSGGNYVTAAELSAMIGGPYTLRVDAIREEGARGLRWSVESVNEEEGTVTLNPSKPAFGQRVYPIGRVQNVGEVTAREKGKPSGYNGLDTERDSDNKHLGRHAAGVPWGDE